MKVQLTPDAAEHLRRKGGHLILFQAPVSGCCGIGSVPMPSWEIGQPRRPLPEYRSLEVDGVMVHIDRTLDPLGQCIQVSLTGFLGWRSLTLAITRNKA